MRWIYHRSTCEGWRKTLDCDYATLQKKAGGCVCEFR